MRQRIMGIFFGLIVLGHATLAWAEEGGALQKVGYGAVSVLGTLVYTPVKAGLCVLGAVATAPVATYDRETAGAMIETMCGGTWAITPGIVKGRDPFHFVGEAS